MTIKLSRHAKRRAKLYKLQESTVKDILKEMELTDGEHEIIRNGVGLKYPLKLVVSVENNTMTVITYYPLKIRKKKMKVHYDEEIDALYLKFGDQEPDGVIEITEGVNIDMADDGKLAGIEILRASDKLNIDTILSYTLELDQGILKNRIA